MSAWDEESEDFNGTWGTEDDGTCDERQWTLAQYVITFGEDGATRILVESIESYLMTLALMGVDMLDANGDLKEQYRD